MMDIDFVCSVKNFKMSILGETKLICWSTGPTIKQK